MNNIQQFTINSNDMPFWLALWRAPNMGPIRFNQLLQYFPKLSDLFAAGQEKWRQLDLPPSLFQYLNSPDWRGVENDLAWAEQENHFILTLYDADYPPLLREISDAPPVIFVNGDKKILQSQQIAIVGSRHPTPAGLDNAFRFAKYFTENGWIITSGLAEGIDCASHQGALANLHGKTIAVLGNGIDKIYPRQHKKLANSICEQGALVSEFPTGVLPIARNFPRRNRIISGLSLGVLVVEAAAQSGSLITAHTAVEQGREVFAIPGSIHNPLARGCHDLLRLGAKLVEKASDICEELEPLLSRLLQFNKLNNCKKDKTKHTNENAAQPSMSILDNTNSPKLSAKYQQLLDCIDYTPTSIDTLVVRSGLTAAAVSSMLLQLELQGVVVAELGGYTRMTRYEG